jgi:arsenate reductase
MNVMEETYKRVTRKNVLFLCDTNSVYSPIAEAYLQQMASKKFIAYSAGIYPKKVHPIIVQVMKEEGIDLTFSQSKSLFGSELAFVKFDYVISFCDPENPTLQPVFPYKYKKIKWNVRSTFAKQDTDLSSLQAARKTRDQIKASVDEFVEEQLAMFEEYGLQLA